MRKKIGIITIVIAAVTIVSLGISRTVQADTTCTFTTVDSTMTLDDDCTTDETILILDGYTLDGNNFSITAVDPSGGHFVGAVVANEGTVAHVTRLTITADGLLNACDAGADRLRGIMFEGASGSITHNTIFGINQGPSGCQEGNAIEVRNGPFDGSGVDPIIVEIAHNVVENYQKTGIVANGNVDVLIHHNSVGASATQENLAANSIQVGFGATNWVTHNNIDGNQWMGTSDYAASAVLIYIANETYVSQNNIRGNSDVGLFVVSDNGTYDNNRVFDIGPDHPNSGYDVGVGGYGTNNTFTNNKSRGFEVPYEGVSEGKNKVIPGPQNFD